VQRVHGELATAGACPRFVGARLGTVTSSDGDDPLHVEVTLETAPAVLWDAVVLPGGDAGVDALSQLGHTVDFVKDQYRHGKPILAVGEGTRLLTQADVPAQAAGVVVTMPTAELGPAVKGFVKLLAGRRCYERETEQPTAP